MSEQSNIRKKGRNRLKAEKNLHDRIVEDILPSFAQELQKEGVISSFNRETFRIEMEQLFLNSSFPAFVIIPDLLLILPDKKRFLVEIVNPRDPKRLMGELASVQFLGFHNLIDAAMVFLLPRGPESVSAPDKGVRLFQGGQFINQLFQHKVPTWIVSWSTKDDYSLSNLKSWILSRQPSWWFTKEPSKSE